MYIIPLIIYIKGRGDSSPISELVTYIVSIFPHFAFSSHTHLIESQSALPKDRILLIVDFDNFESSMFISLNNYRRLSITIKSMSFKSNIT